MNNKQKLQQTETRVKEIREKCEKSLAVQMRGTGNLSKRLEISRKKLILFGLDFQETKPDIAFCSQTYSMVYRPMKLNRKLRVRAVPICFLVTLYEQELQAVFPKEDIRIPYDLRAFWKKKQAVQFTEDFVKFQNKSQEILLWEHRRLEHEEKSKAAEYFKILEEFIEMKTSNCGWKKEITYHDLHFVINTKNVKVDVVPLCKILTKYYANVVMKINRYLKAKAPKAEEDRLVDIEEDFRAFMERYFVKIP